MLTKMFLRFPKWEADYLRELAQKKGLTTTDLIRLATYFFILEYKGKCDQETVDNMEFRARTKVHGGHKEKNN